MIIHNSNNNVHLSLKNWHHPIGYYTVADIDQLRNRIDERTQDCLRFGEEIDTLKNQFQSECLLFNQTLQDEKYRVEVSYIIVMFTFHFCLFIR